MQDDDLLVRFSEFCPNWARVSRDVRFLSDVEEPVEFVTNDELIYFYHDRCSASLFRPLLHIVL